MRTQPLPITTRHRCINYTQQQTSQEGLVVRNRPLTYCCFLTPDHTLYTQILLLRHGLGKHSAGQFLSFQEIVSGARSQNQQHDLIDKWNMLEF